MIVGFALRERHGGGVELEFAAGQGGVVGDLQDGGGAVGEREIERLG